MTPESPKSASRGVWEVPLTIATLREIGLFGALSDEVLDLLAGRLRTVRVSPGDEVFREGEALAREMYVVLDGEMEVSKRGRRGGEVRIAILGPGDWFGEMSMIDMQPRSATVRALAPSQLLQVTSEDLDRLYRSDLKSYALIVLNIARGMSRRLRVRDAIAADSPPASSR
ncbi:MAG TPA: cyclic nucleotide-binding domain-containing protein [Polyangiaceae bacterium]|jgi:CRP-like cAMP-binding protein